MAIKTTAHSALYFRVLLALICWALACHFAATYSLAEALLLFGSLDGAGDGPRRVVKAWW
jgi:hypothetical protein